MLPLIFLYKYLWHLHTGTNLTQDSKRSILTGWHPPCPTSSSWPAAPLRSLAKGRGKVMLRGIGGDDNVCLHSGTSVVSVLWDPRALCPGFAISTAGNSSITFGATLLPLPCIHFLLMSLNAPIVQEGPPPPPSGRYVLHRIVVANRFSGLLICIFF